MNTFVKFKAMCTVSLLCSPQCAQSWSVSSVMWHSAVMEDVYQASKES